MLPERQSIFIQSLPEVARFKELVTVLECLRVHDSRICTQEVYLDLKCKSETWVERLDVHDKSSGMF